MTKIKKDSTRIANNFSTMYSDPIASDANAGKTLGGNIADFRNCCCIRLTHALRKAGHAFVVPNIYFTKFDYKDKVGNGYIIKCDTMEKYLQTYITEPVSVTAKTAQGKKGIIYFKNCGWDDASGHFDLWNGSRAAYHDSDSEGHSYFNLASAVYLYQ